MAGVRTTGQIQHRICFLFSGSGSVPSTPRDDVKAAPCSHLSDGGLGTFGLSASSHSTCLVGWQHDGFQGLVGVCVWFKPTSVVCLVVGSLFNNVGSSRAWILSLTHFKPSPFLNCKSHCLPSVAAVNFFETWGERKANSHQAASMPAIWQLGAAGGVNCLAKSKGKSLPARRKKMEKRRGGSCPLSCVCN